MPRAIPQETLDEILSRVDIVELISGFIPLKRAGRNFKALCPFHQEKTASFMINPDKQIYHCFGCGVGGNAFNFLMQYESIEFPEAVEQLAKKVGVVLPEHPEESAQTSMNTSLYKINELAAAYYHNLLHSPEGLNARNYLNRRGINSEIIKKFKLGFASENWDGLLRYLRAKGFSLNLLEKSGLIIPKQGGGYFDRFRGRLMFPVFDIKSRVIAFGGRILAAEKDKELAKYINSSESQIYIKGRNLYGLNSTKDIISKSDVAVIVEGYMDFLSLYQRCIQNVIASQGTALTQEQLRLLKRYSRNVTMIFDGDSAGQAATLRSLDIFLEEDMHVSVVALPSGFDPDTFVNKFGAEKLKERIGSAADIFEYKLSVLKTQYDIRKAHAKADIAAEMLATIAKVKNAVLKSEYIRRLSESIEIEEGVLLAELKNIKPSRHNLSLLPQVVSRPKTDINPTEKLLLRLMLEEADAINELKGYIEPADFQDEKAAKIVSAIFDLTAEGKSVGPSQLISYFNENEISSLIGELGLNRDGLLENNRRREVMHDCIQRIKRRRWHSRKEQLCEEIKLAQELKDEERLRYLTQQFHQLIREREK